MSIRGRVAVSGVNDRYGITRKFKQGIPHVLSNDLSLTGVNAAGRCGGIMMLVAIELGPFVARRRIGPK
jgi:hypothetical protein